jgi:Tfp pilus assembly protein PilV
MSKLRSDRIDGRNGHRLGSEAGMGLAEVLVSLLVFSVAILGIIGTSARVGLAVNGAHGRLAAEAVARQQAEMLLAQPTSMSTTGTASRDGVSMAWTISESFGGRRVQLDYRYVLPSGVRADTLTAATVRR